MHERTIADEIAEMLPRLRRFTRSLAGATDGDDLAQSTVERALSRTHLFEPGTRLDSWLFRMAQNLYRNDLSAARRREQPTPPAVLAATGPTVEGDAEARLLLAEANAAIDALPAEQRAALALVALDGETYATAAELLGWDFGTVASRVSRARAAVRTKLGL
jgi:RNA polymerase sigma-70 factor, ECF subfamily